MSDTNVNANTTMEVPVNGRGTRAFIEGTTLHIQVDLTGPGTVSTTGKTNVIATMGFKGLTVPGAGSAGRTVSCSGSFYIPVSQD